MSVTMAQLPSRPLSQQHGSPMAKYKTLYAWMILPLVLMQVGIFMDYWRELSQNDWTIHIHYWTATLWYLYLIVQPYLATHGRMAFHRTNGMIGVFLAGGMGIGSFGMLNGTLELTVVSAEHPDRFGPFTPDFFYGIVIGEMVMALVFMLALIMGILRRKDFENHAWWLTATAFIIMMPALGRGIQNLWIGLHIEQWPSIDVMTPLLISQALIIGLTLAAAWKYEQLKHPATWWAIVVNANILVAFELGKLDMVQQLLNAVIRV
ncbi:MAG: hypothetical protein AAGH65_05890 [Pseudomonadota bacterium]